MTLQYHPDSNSVVSFIADQTEHIPGPLSSVNGAENPVTTTMNVMPEILEPHPIYTTPTHRSDTFSTYLLHSTNRIDYDAKKLTYFQPIEFESDIGSDEEIAQHNPHPINGHNLKPETPSKGVTPPTSVYNDSTSPLLAKRTEEYHSGSKPSSASPPKSIATVNILPQSIDDAKNKRNVIFDVLARLSRSKATEDDQGRKFSDDMRQYWMADQTCRECYECGITFNTFRRRHHCRICGQIFCTKCCSEYAPGKFFGLNTNQRVCSYCFRVIRDYAQTTSGTADMNNFILETRNLSQQKPKFPSFSVNDSNSTHEIPMNPNIGRSRTPVKISLKSDSSMILPHVQASLDIDPSCMDILDEDELTIAKDTLLTVWIKMQDINSGLIPQTHRHRLKQYHNAITGVQVIDWLIQNKIAESQHYGEIIGQALVDAKWLTPATNLTVPFKYDNRPYHLQHSTEANDSNFRLEKDMDDPLWLQAIAFNDEDEESFDVQNAQSTHIPSKVNRGHSFSNRDANLAPDSTPQNPPETQPEGINADSQLKSLATKLSQGVSFVDAFLGNSYMASPTQHLRRANSLGQLNLMTHANEFPYLDQYHFGDSLNLPYVPSLQATDDLSTSALSNKRHGSDPCYLDKTVYLDWTDSNSETLNDYHTSIKGIRRKSFFEFDESEAHKRLDQYSNAHLNSLMLQELERAGLSSKWFDVLMPIIAKISQTVRLNLQHDEVMDIRKFVKFKKIPGGTKTDSEIIYGVVCSKNLTSKHTQKQYHKPKILLLRCAFEFERKENKFSSFDMLIMQEKEYISNLVNKVLALEPNLVIVERSIARIAQEMLMKNGITLVTNMKPSVINRIARSTRGHQLVSLDQLFWEIQLGVCKKFYLKTFTISENQNKTLMFFEGCPPVLGCTVCLRGESRNELVKIKCIAKFLLLAAYNLQLENAFIMDTFTKPQPLRPLPKYEIRTNYPTPPATPRLKLAPAIQSDTDFNQTIDPLSGSTLCTQTTEEPGYDLTAPFYNVFNKHIFTLSPYLVLSPPFLHTFNGSLSKVRKYLPGIMYWSGQFDPVDEALVVQTSSSREQLCATLMQDETMAILRGLSFINNEPRDNEKKKPKNAYKKFENSNYSNTHEAAIVDSYHKIPPGFIKGVTFKSCDYFSSSTAHWFVNGVMLRSASKKMMDFLLADYRSTAQFSHLYHDKVPPYPYMRDKSIKIDKNLLTGSKRFYGLERNDDLKAEIPVLESSQEFLELDQHDYFDDITYSSKRIDCFDMQYHQKIPVLFSSKSSESPNWPSACIKPWVIVMDFYGKKDIDLYNFLMRYCFRPNYNCLSDKCRVKMDKHIRYFAHGDAAIVLRTNVMKEQSSEFEHIRTWGQCVTCNVRTPVSPLSPDAQAFSFAKFLELKFYGKHLIRRLTSQQCTHSVYSDQVQYFSYGRWIAAFEYHKLNLKDVVLPSSILTFNAMELLLNQNWAKALKYLNKKMSETFNCLYTKLDLLKESAVRGDGCFADYKLKLAREETDLMEKLKSLIEKADEFGCFSEVLDQSKTKAFYKDTLEYLQDHLAHIKGLFSRIVQKWNNLYQGLADSESTSKQRTNSGQPAKGFSEFSSSVPSREYSIPIAIPEEIESKSTESENLPNSEKSDGVEKIVPQDLSNISHSPRMHQGSFSQQSGQSSIPTSPVRSSTFLVLSKQGSSTAPSTPEIIGEVYTNQPLEAPKRQLSEPPNIGLSKMKTMPKMISRSIEKKNPPQKVVFTPVPFPFNPGEHFTLDCGQIPLAIYESEPSSIIAYGLNSPSYKDKLSLILKRDKKERIHKKLAASNSSNNDPTDESLDLSMKSESLLDHEDHIELEFEDSGTHFYCKVYYAQQFMRLREEIYSEGEDGFIRSLSRCVDWAARGGKTRATFRKVLDNQFIIKQMSRTEVDSFVTFANGYFSYIKAMVGKQKPTALAKVLGVYRIGFRNTITNQTMKEDVLVIENVFYTYKCSKVFDLKGSLRNRYMQPNNKESDVLLDENLLEYIGETPIFLRPHAKGVLACAVENDSAFLSKHLIMDYSLLVGINEETQQLLVGIIDYIRTFTWDKKLEMWVKSSGILGGGGKAPTVISPEKYKKRFCEAIDKYFPMVPDKWTVFGTEKIHLSS